MFKQLPGGERARVEQMMRRVSEFHETACHQILRYPNKPQNLHRRPVMIAVPETAWRSVLKETGPAIARPNGGQHVHAAFLSTPSRWSRLQGSFLAHFEAKKQGLYIRNCDGRPDILRDIHVVAMDRGWGTVWGYMTKEGGRDRRFADDILILPRASSELG